MDKLVAQKAAEQTIDQRRTKYTSHIAYHLYQMYLAKEESQKKKDADPEDSDLRIPADDEMQDEINRVASTLIRLMDVMH